MAASVDLMTKCWLVSTNHNPQKLKETRPSHIPTKKSETATDKLEVPWNRSYDRTGPTRHGEQPHRQAER